MSIRKNENYGNRRKYSEQDVEEMRQAEAEDAIDTAEWLAKMAERKTIIVRGLVQKYGFSQAGADQTMSLIEKGVNVHTGHCPLDDARFGSEEKRQAAQAAFKFYWK